MDFEITVPVFQSTLCHLGWMALHMLCVSSHKAQDNTARLEICCKATLLIPPADIYLVCNRYTFQGQSSGLRMQ